MRLTPIMMVMKTAKMTRTAARTIVRMRMMTVTMTRLTARMTKMLTMTTMMAVMTRTIRPSWHRMR